MDTRDQLLRAAEELYARRSVDAVSLREIQRASGVKNATALQYHFGNRDGLLKALLDKHIRDIEPRRQALLDRYEAHAQTDVRALGEALVLPLAAKLDDEGGSAYLRVCADMLQRRPPAGGDVEISEPSLIRWRALVEPLLDPTAIDTHRRLVVVRFTLGELASRAATAPHTDNRVFNSQLIDLVTAMLVAPASAETTRLTAARAEHLTGPRRRVPNRR